MERVISGLGLGVMVLLAIGLSADRRRINWRTVGLGLLLQIGVALCLIGPLSSLGLRKPLEWFGNGVNWLIDQVDSGAGFVFGPGFKDHYVAFKVLPTIIFFSALMSALFHLGVIQRVVRAFGRLMQHFMKTSGAESLSAAANIFVGQTEAPLVIKPYLKEMTRSEIMAVMVGGFATVAGGVMAAYIGFGIPAVHLLTASLISAPAALVVAKIMQPETETPKTVGGVNTRIAESESVNVLHALSIGASDGLKLALNVGAMLIAFLAVIAVLDAAIVHLGLLVSAQLGFRSAENWSLASMMGTLFAPFAFCMGIESKDCLRVGELLGLRTAANEFLAYERLAAWMKPESGVSLSPRSVAITTYALCGFANFGSIGIQIGGIGELCPERKTDLASLSLRAMIGGTLACFMTACIAGVFV
jgi:CNT family concentrative nucleoside transporter